MTKIKGRIRIFNRIKIRSLGTRQVVYTYATRSVQYLDAGANKTPSATFGYSMAVSADGKRIAVGAPYDSGGAAVYVFDLMSTNWTRTARILDNGIVNPGYKVGISGNGMTIAIGGTQTGDTAIYNLVGATWVRKAYVSANSNPSTINLDYEGKLLILGSSSNVLRVFTRNSSGNWPTAYGVSRTNIGTRAGSVGLTTDAKSIVAATVSNKVEIYDLFAATASLQSSMTSSYIIETCDISGDGLVVAASSGNGQVIEIYTRPNRTSTVWSLRQGIQRGNVTTSANGSFVSLSENGSLLLLGSDTGFNSSAPTAFVYQRSGNVWSEVSRYIGVDAYRTAYHGVLARNESVALIGEDVYSQGRGRLVLLTPTEN